MILCVRGLGVFENAFLRVLCQIQVSDMAVCMKSKSLCVGIIDETFASLWNIAVITPLSGV